MMTILRFCPSCKRIALVITHDDPRNGGDDSYDCKECGWNG
jgi:predicted RNA-binding Zn-ribbon protein involved in translation (DUF1610 family)